MKSLNSKVIIAVLVIASLFSLKVPAQNTNSTAVIKELQNAKDDSVHSSLSFYSTEFEVNDLSVMHKKLDSIFNSLDKDLNKKIKVLAFKLDSVNKGFMLFQNFDFQMNMDSLMDEFSKRYANDKRVEELLKKHLGTDVNSNMVFNDSLLSGKNHIMNIEVMTDSIQDGAKTIVKQKIIIKSDIDTIGNENPVIIEKVLSDDGTKSDVTISYQNKKEVIHPDYNVKVEKFDKVKKDAATNIRSEYIEEIPLADIDILLKAGIPARVIIAPELIPDKINLNVKSEEKFGHQKRIIALSLDFSNQSSMQVILLNNNGRNIFEENKKKFAGTYSHEIEIDESMVPYYFLIIKNGKLFGRLIK